MDLHLDYTAIMGLASDLLLVIGAFGAGIYCLILARRLKRFNNLENGVGGAVAVLSAQVDDMTKTLTQARKAAAHSAASLTELTERAESSARKLELMMASLHDLPEAPSASEVKQDADWNVEVQKNATVDIPQFSTKRAVMGTER